MNSRERLLETFDFGSPDRVFRWECIAYWGETIERWRSEGLRGHPDEVFRMDEQISPLDFRGRIPVLSGFTGTPFVPAFEREVLRENENSRIVRDGNRVLKREFKSGKGQSIPQWLEFPVKSESDYDELVERLDPNDPRRYGDGWDNVEDQFRGREFPIAMPLCGFFGHLRNLVGPSKVPHFMYREAPLVRRILAYWTDFNKTVLGNVQEKLDLDYIMVWEDMCYRTGPLISPALFEEFLLPCYAELTAYARSIGVENVIVDSDGNVSDLLPLFVRGGVKGMIPFEVQAGNDIAEIRERYPDLVIFGGLDKLALAKGKREIDAELEEKVPFVLESGGFVPALDHAAPPDIPFSNFRYYMKRIRELEEAHQ